MITLFTVMAASIRIAAEATSKVFAIRTIGSVKKKKKKDGGKDPRD
jgi:hypothetical protein